MADPAQPSLSEAPTDAAATMENYRQEMRERFDAYMKERQAKMEEMTRRQREVATPPQPPTPPTAMPSRPAMPYGAYPNMPPYGPRYPAAFPGYQTPYWQQPPAAPAR